MYLVRKYQLRTWRRDRHFYVVFQATRRSSRLQIKGSISFHCRVKTPSIGPVPRIELATSSSTGQRFTDWANPAVVLFGFLIAIFLLFQKQRPAFLEVLRVFCLFALQNIKNKVNLWFVLSCSRLIMFDSNCSIAHRVYVSRWYPDFLLVQATFSGTNGLLKKLLFRMAFFPVVECFHSCVPSPSRLFPFWKWILQIRLNAVSVELFSYWWRTLNDAVK